jgi:hypothetical protein
MVRLGSGMTDPSFFFIELVLFVGGHPAARDAPRRRRQEPGIDGPAVSARQQNRVNALA